MPEVIATLEAVIGANVSGLQRGLQEADRGLSGFAQTMSQRLDSIGSSMQKLGLGITAIAAPLAGAFADGVRQALTFEESMANIGAVLNQPISELGELSAQIREIGAASRYGPQQAALAFYDIVGGVADAASHMAIFEAAIHTAQAGNADLMGTTSALISVMNSYGFSADQATWVSDILTQTVAKGVGTMDELGAAIADVAGIAASAGVAFSEAGAGVAYVSTKGFSFSESATRIRQAIVALLNPNKEMTEALKAAGLASGSTALETYGLAGTYRKLSSVLGSTDALQQATGSVWAMQGALAVTEDGFTSFADAFGDAALGVTAAAEKIQMATAAARWDKFKSRLEDLRIEIGDALLPAFEKLLDAATPLVAQFTEWARANSGVITAIAGVTAVALPLGIALSGLGTVVRGLGLLLSPGGLVVAGIGATAVGIGVLGQVLGVDMVGWFESALNYVRDFPRHLQEAGGDIGQVIRNFLLMDDDDPAQSFGEKLVEVGDKIGAFLSDARIALSPFPFYVEYYIGGAFSKVSTWIDENVLAPLRGIAVAADIALAPVRAWFDTNIPAGVDELKRVLGLVEGTLQDLWNNAKPFVEPIVQWFEEAARKIAGFFQPVIDGITRVFNEAADAWEQLRRMGGGTPQRTLIGESAPGVPGTPGVRGVGSIQFEELQRIGENLLSDIASGIVSGARSRAHAQAVTQIALAGLPERLIGDLIKGGLDRFVALLTAGANEGTGKIGKASADAARKMLLEGDTLGKAAYDTGTSIAQGMSGFAAQLVGQLPTVTDTLQTVGANLWQTIVDFASGLRDWAVSTFQRVFGGAGATSGAQTMNLIGTAFTNPQVNADRTAAMMGALQYYYHPEIQNSYYPGMAEGGPVQAGRTYVVGERGPELFTPSSGGAITPNGSDANLADEIVRRVLAALLPGGVPSARLREVIVNRVLEELALG